MQDRESFQKEEEKIVIKPACLKKPWHWKASVAEARALWQNKEVQREQSEQVPGGERKERARGRRQQEWPQEEKQPKNEDAPSPLLYPGRPPL